MAGGGGGNEHLARQHTLELHQPSARCQARTPIGQLVTVPTKPPFQPPPPPPSNAPTEARGRAGGVAGRRDDDGAEARGAGGHQLPGHGRGAQGLPQRRGPHAPVPGGPLRLRRGRHPRARRRRPVHAAGGQHPAGARAAHPGRPARRHALLPLQRPRPAAARRDRGGRRHRVRRVHRALRPQPHQRPRLHGTRGEGPRRLPLHHGLRLVPQRRPDRQDQGADREQHQAEQEQPAPGRRHEASIRFRDLHLHLPPADHPWGFESLGAHLPCHGHHKQSTQNGGKEPDAKTEAEPSTIASVATANRSLLLPTFIGMLRDKTGRHDVGVGSIRTTLFHHFGHDASPKVKRFVKVMVGRLRHDGKLGDEEVEQPHAFRAALEQDAHSVEEVYAGPAAAAAAARAGLPRNGVLVSGCQTDETSADATTPDGVSYGALSNAIQAVLAGRKRGAAVTNRELVVRARELLSKQGYTQQPGLYCSDEHAKLSFIC